MIQARKKKTSSFNKGNRPDNPPDNPPDIEDCHIPQCGTKKLSTTSSPDKKYFCNITGRMCKYRAGVDCMHPILNYLNHKIQNKPSDDYKETEKYDLDRVYTNYQLSGIINRIYLLDIFDADLLYISIFYFEKFLRKTKIICTKKNLHVIWFLSVMISSKFVFDNPYSNKTFSLLFEIDLQTLNYVELMYLADIKFKLHYDNCKLQTKKIRCEIIIYQIHTVCDAVVPFSEWKSFQEKYHQTV